MTEIDLSTLTPVLETLSLQGRTALLPALHAAQQQYGYIPAPAAAEIGRALGVPLSEVYGVIDFYALFRTEPIGSTVIHVCNDPACSLAGADALYKLMHQEARLNPETGGPELTIERAPCLGLCEHAPALLVEGRQVRRVSPNAWEDFVTARLQIDQAHFPPTYIGREVSILTGNCFEGRTTWLNEYEQNQGYSALWKALGMSRLGVIEEIKASGLVGRGGAAFPTGVKWESAAQAPGWPKYVVCNADEAEPGTFKDRVLMEHDPHRILEGLIISGYAIGAVQGYWYIRGEYTEQYAIALHAIQEAREAGYLGRDIQGSGFEFDVELRLGAGAYICGEETALFESIEGKRGFPRVKPPFPTTHGLFGRPTVINNVETLANIPYILSQGAAHYRTIGTERSPGPKLFCLSGDVEKPGLYEVPFGVTLGHLIYTLAGGVRDGRQLKAVLIGGAAGAFATPAHMDVRLTFEDLRAAGLPLGSGVITVFDETRDLRDTLLRLAHFFAEESCGKCYPCQIGTQRQYEMIERLAAGRLQAGDLERLTDVGWTMTDSSLCGLGQTAASAVLSAIKNWPELFTS